MKTSLELIIDSLKLSDEEKAELYENIRNFDLEDDNDPLLRISLFLSMLAKFTDEIPEKLAYERQLIELSLKEFKSLTDKVIQQNRLFLKQQAVIGKSADNRKNVKTGKLAQHSKYYFAGIIMVTVLGIVFNYFYTATPIIKTYQTRKEFLKKCSSLPEVFKIKNKAGWFIAIENKSELKLRNGEYAAKLRGYY